MRYYLIIAILIVIFIGFYYCKRSKRITSETVMENKDMEEEVNNEEVGEVVKPERFLRTSHDLSKQCIRLLGDFMVKDRNGKDISGLFTPKLRLLLTMIILSTEENPDGVSGDVIIQRLWNTKNKYAARNNRNVTLTKLRNILGEVGHVEIINLGNCWKITFGEDVLCDYSEVLTYLEAIKENRLKDEFHLCILLDLLYRGTLLYHTEAKWLNQYKGCFTYQIIESLSSLLKDPGITGHELKMKIADTLLQHDYINEEALQVQCVLLYRTGQIELMKSCYNNFCTNYANLLGIRYNKTLKRVLNPLPGR